MKEEKISSAGIDRAENEQASFNSLMTNLLMDFISMDINQTEVLIQKALVKAANHFGADGVFIGIFDKKKNELSSCYRWSVIDGVIKNECADNIPLDDFPWSKSRALAGHEIRITDVESSKQLKEKTDLAAYRSAGVKSVLVIPLSVKQSQLRGSLSLWSKKGSLTCTENQYTNLKLLGDLITSLLNYQNVELEREKRERYISLLGRFTQYAFESTDFFSVLNKMSVDLAELMQADFCGFGLLKEDNQTISLTGITGINQDEFEKVGEVPLADSITEFVLQTDKRLVLENINESKFKNSIIARLTPVKSLIVVPIKIRKKKFGAVFIGFVSTHHFSEQEIEMSEQAAAQITLSINNMQAYLENVRHIEELNTLSIMSTALRKAESLSDMPGKVIDRIIAMKLAESVVMVIYEDPTQAPALVDWGGKWQACKNKGSEALHELSIVDEVMKTGKVIQKDVIDGEYPSLTEEGASSGIHYVLCFPLQANHQTLGVLCVGNSNPFKENNISLLNAVAETVSNAVYRQSMFDNLQTHLETLRTTKIQLVQSEKLAAIGELIAGVAHELNNPLTTISLSAELLLQQSVNEQDILDLEKIVSESQRAAKIVKGLLDFSRQKAPERQAVDINSILKSTTDLISWEIAKNDINMSFDMAEDLPLTMADPNQLKQVFINIINNAVQAIKSQNKSGRIKIHTEIGPSLFFGNESSNEDMIRIIITDDGPGIPPAILPRIFDPFFTTKKIYEGTGLGLSVCHGIISEHKGHIWARNENEGGTSISIEIPIDAPDETVMLESKSQSTKGNASDRLLIVEDENGVLEVMQRALMRKGYLVDGVSNGLEGLDCLSEHKYSVIICDIRMSGMNGFEFYQEVKKVDPRLSRKIIFTSGDSIKPEYSSFLKLTGATFLPKPFELNQLLEIVHEKITEVKGTE